MKKIYITDGDMWKDGTFNEARINKMQVVRCLYCNEPAVYMDERYPYYEDGCLCARHKNFKPAKSPVAPRFFALFYDNRLIYCAIGKSRQITDLMKNPGAWPRPRTKYRYISVKRMVFKKIESGMWWLNSIPWHAEIENYVHIEDSCIVASDITIGKHI